MKTDYLAHDRKYLDLRASGAAGWDPAEEYTHREPLLAWAMDRLPTSGTRLLELGCGAGNMAPWFVARGYTVTGVDIAPAAIAWATDKQIAGAAFEVGNVVDGIAGEHDVIVDGNCLHCIIGDDRAKLLANVRNALAFRGAFILATMCGAVTIPKLREQFDDASHCQIVDGVAYRYIGAPEDILAELRAAGLSIAARRIVPRANPDADQDHLWAVCTAAS